MVLYRVRSTGTVELVALLPPGVDAQPNFPSSVTGLVLRVVGTGFADDESGIVAFEWAVGTRPLTEDVMPFTMISDGASGRVVRARELPGLVPGMELFHSLRVTNGARHTQPFQPFNPQSAFRALKRALAEGTMNHSKSAAIVRNCW